MAIINVTTTVDENNGTGEVSLREAIIQANRVIGDDTIVLVSGQTYKLSLVGIDEDQSATGDLDILFGGNITILTSGDGKATIDGGGIDRVFDVTFSRGITDDADTASLTLKNIIVTGGKTNKNGGGIYNRGYLVEIDSSVIIGNEASIGSGINNSRGTLNIVNSTISDNSALVEGGGILNAGIGKITNSTISSNSSSSEGGGIFNIDADLTLTNSTISGNKSSINGGGIFNTGSLVVSNSTISDNFASLYGGGIYNRDQHLNINNSIVTGNYTYINISYGNVGVLSTGTSIINNDIVVANLISPTSQGNNLIGSGNLSFAPTDKVGVDPLLGPLQNNGGPTATHALLTGSPAINAGNSTLTRDQRGFGRNGIADIGAFEYEGINDLIPPSVISFSPADDTTGVSPITDLVINFSEPITKTITGNVFIKKLTDNSIVETIAGGSDKMTVNGSQLIINPGSDLAGGTDYYVEISEGVVTDIIGNNFLGITGNTSWNFQTIAPPDTTPPTASSFTPADNATGVSLASNLTVNFSEPIQKGFGSIVIKKVADNSVLETINITSTNVTVSGNQLTINPTKNLSLNTDYYVEIGNGAIQDLAGNNYSGITGKTAWNFKSITATSGADKIIGTAGNDTIDGLAGNDTISGLGGNDRLLGSGGDDSINGGTGDDTMIGGPGNDTYIVNSVRDRVVESLNAGTDSIFSTVTYTLPANVENLTLQGTQAINGTGNTLVNRIVGNSATNRINGGGGNDILNGGGGNDVFLVNPGNDRLTGGTGADRFIYNTNATFTRTAVGVDTITDFIISQNDKIVLDKTTFPKITSANGTGFSRDAEFAKVSSNTAAAISGADIVYNTVTGELFYNQNGTATGFGTGGKFAVFSNKPNLTENQFIIQA